MEKKYNVKISAGNMKLGTIANLSLTPGVSCSECAKKTCLVSGCYACKAYRQYKNVRAAWDRNTDMAINDLPTMEKELNEYFGCVNSPRYFRVHVGGDFITAEYAAMWARVAANNPGTRFLAFTKQWDNVRGVDFPANFSLVLSAWEGVEIPADLSAKYSTAFCVNTPEKIPAGALECPGNCSTCGVCWELSKRGINVAFLKH